MSKSRAQGLPLNVIVLAAIAALVLILIVAFTIGGLGGFFKQITTASGIEELSTVQTACSSACSRAQVTATTLIQFKNSDYCKKTFTIDLNKNGKIDAGETGLKCWTASTTVGDVTFLDPIGIDCVGQTPAGEQYNKTTCTT
ncbi:MAG: hypothetical protein QW063_00450 [Candidatus Nanoarchaeia archaeon]